MSHTVIIHCLVKKKLKLRNDVCDFVSTVKVLWLARFSVGLILVVILCYLLYLFCIYIDEDDDDDDDLSDLDYNEHRKCNGPSNNLDNSNYGNTETTNNKEDSLQEKSNGQGNFVKVMPYLLTA